MIHSDVERYIICVCVCVCERERERQRQRETERDRESSELYYSRIEILGNSPFLQSFLAG